MAVYQKQASEILIETLDISCHNRYTYKFNVYAGTDGGETLSENGIAYSVVLKLIYSLL